MTPIKIIEKKCKGSRISIDHYFLPNDNATPVQKYAEHLGYCVVCWFAIPSSQTSLSSGFIKKYDKRNDKADCLPSKDYE